MQIQNPDNKPYNFPPELQPLFDAMERGDKIKSITCMYGRANEQHSDLDFQIAEFRATEYYVGMQHNDHYGWADLVETDLPGDVSPELDKKCFYMSWVRSFQLYNQRTEIKLDPSTLPEDQSLVYFTPEKTEQPTIGHYTAEDQVFSVDPKTWFRAWDVISWSYADQKDAVAEVREKIKATPKQQHQPKFCQHDSKTYLADRHKHPRVYTTRFSALTKSQQLTRQGYKVEIEPSALGSFYRIVKHVQEHTLIKQILIQINKRKEKKRK